MASDVQGSIALHCAASYGHSAVAQQLIEAGHALLFYKDVDGSTPLHKAALRGHVEVSKVLVKLGGKRLLAERDRKDRTAQEVAKSGGHDQLVVILYRAHTGRAAV